MASPPRTATETTERAQDLVHAPNPSRGDVGVNGCSSMADSTAASQVSLASWSDQRKSQLHHFTIGFQKPGICADSWFLESNGKMVQLGFSLIKNRAPHGTGLVPTGLYFLLPVMCINLQVLTGSGGMIVLWLNRVYLETRELNPRRSEKIPIAPFYHWIPETRNLRRFLVSGIQW
jgi:hypothetical protein